VIGEVTNGDYHVTHCDVDKQQLQNSDKWQLTKQPIVSPIALLFSFFPRNFGTTAANTIEEETSK
jgi:hypothetical protein